MTTINTIMEQPNVNYELILVNDGSTDGSGDLCNELAQAYTNIKVIHQKNTGPSAARNAGIEVAKGHYMMFIDAGDYVDNNHINIMFSSIEEYESDLIIAGYKNVYRNKNLKSSVIMPEARCLTSDNEIKSDFNSLIDDDVFTPVWNKLYRTEIIKNTKLRFNESYILGEDFIFNVRYTLLCKNITIINKASYNYMIESQSLSHSYKKNKFSQLKPVTLEFKDILTENNLSLEPFYYRLMRNFYSSTIELFHKDCNYTYSQKVSYTKKLIKDQDIEDMLLNYKPRSIYKKIIFLIMKLRNHHLILMFSKLFYIKKFGMAKS